MKLQKLDEAWIPMPGQGLSIEFPDSADALRSAAKYNDESWTLVAPPGQTRVFDYAVKWGSPPEPSAAELAVTNFGAPQAPLQNSASLRLIGTKSSEFTAGAQTDWAKVQALKARLDAGFFTPTTPPGHSYGDLAPMVASPDSMQGNGEHYAALFGVLARAAGVPVRVVVGFVPSSAVRSGTQEVLGKDLRAWAEVNMAGIGWVPVDLTQDPSRKPKPRETKQQITAVELPPPPNVVPSPEPAVPLTEKSKKTERKKAANAKFPIPLPVLIGAGATLGPLALGAAFVTGIVSLKKRRRSKRRTRTSSAGAIAGAWEELLDRSGEAGVVVPRGATLNQVALALGEHESAQDSLTQLVAISDRAAFHAEPPTQEARDLAWKHVEVITDALTFTASRWVRLRRNASIRPLLHRPAL